MFIEGFSFLMWWEGVGEQIQVLWGTVWAWKMNIINMRHCERVEYQVASHRRFI